MTVRLRPGLSVPERTAPRWAGARRDVAAALPGWVTARLVVLGALGLAHILANHVDPALHHRFGRSLHLGLLSWDGRWYLGIAQHGYARLSDEALRFFPLLPLLARALAPLLLGHAGAALVLLANGFALVLGALVHRLCVMETGDEALARRAAWLVALAPPLFVMVMGYSEPIALSLAVAGFLALRRRRWGWAAAAGFVAGLTRPVGALLVVPAAIEAARGLRGAPRADRLSRALAVVSPVAGTCVFLAWVGARFGDAFLPLRIQNRPDLRGGFANPLVTVWRAFDGVLHGQAGTNGIHLPWVVILAGLVVVTLRRWPVAYGAYAGATFVVALSARHLGSFERYGFGAFPVVLGLASVVAAPWSERLVLTGAAATMAGYALCAFLHIYVP